MAFGLEIKRLREEAPISAQKLADKIGIDASRLRKWEEKDLTPRLEDVQKIETFFGIAIDKVMELKSIKKFLIVPHEKKEMGDNQLKEEGTPLQTPNFRDQLRDKKNSHTPQLVPLVPVKAQAGYVRSFDQSTFLDTLEKYALPPGVDPHGAIWRYFEIEGDSMEPTFQNGDVILASQVPMEDWQEIRNFYTYVILTDNMLVIKRIFRKSNKNWVLISDNEKEHDQVLLPVNQIKEIWVFRRHIDSKAPPPKKFEIKV